jgi:hypothetical protein
MSRPKKHARALKTGTRKRSTRSTRRKADTYPRPSAAGSAQSKAPFGPALSIEALAGLTSELQVVRQYPPVTKRADGKYEGDILGFVRGLRLSARVLYFLREHLSETGLEVSWGHLLDDKQESCSPECDIIVHEHGVVRRWNGFEDPVMNFSFVKASKVRFVVSCKSLLGSIDADYPKTLKKYGVQKVFLFAESCDESQVQRLRKKAVQAGYSGMWCLYTTNKRQPSFLGTNGGMLVEFGQTLLAAVKPKGRKRKHSTKHRSK